MIYLRVDFNLPFLNFNNFIYWEITKMKKMITMFAATIVAVSAALTPAFGTTYAGVEFNGEKVQFEQDPVIENGRVLVPFRFVAEKLGATVAWDIETKTVTCEKDGVKISLTANVKDVVVSGQSLEIDVPAQIMNSKFSFH